MAEYPASRLWGMRLVFVALSGAVVFVHMIPMSLTPANWAPPDLILAFAFAWALRRPEFVPMLLVAGVALLCDFLFQRPPGLWAALFLLTVEWGKSIERRSEETTFALEWINFAVGVMTITVLYRVVLSVTVSQAGPLPLMLMQTAFTIAVYPLAVLISHFIFRVRRSAPGDIEKFG